MACNANRFNFELALNIKSHFMIKEIKKFIPPFYKDKDIMHDLTHLERIKVALDDLVKNIDLEFDKEIVEAALYFHGFIYSHEKEIISFLEKINIPKLKINLIVKVAWESQKENRPTTNEGLVLHDAHMLEGGKNFEIVKSLITGSVRGQSLEETMVYIENNLLSKGHCYTEEGKQRYLEMKATTVQLFEELNNGLGRKN